MSAKGRHKTHWDALPKTIAVPTHQAIEAGLPTLALNNLMTHKTTRRLTLIDRRPPQIRSWYPGRMMKAATLEAASPPSTEKGNGPHHDWLCEE